MPTSGARIRRLPLLTPVVLVALLLAGCQSAPTEDLQEEIAGLPGVEIADVDSARVKVTLDGELAAADTQSAIVGVRDAAVAGHPLGDEVELVVVVPFGPRDNGGSAPWEAYGYARWAGTSAAEAFAQQATFVASLADWQTVLTTPARILQVGFDVEWVPTDPDAESPAPTEEPDPDASPTAPVTPPQVVTLHVGQAIGAANAEADIAALIDELGALWVASGGDPEGIAID